MTIDVVRGVLLWSAVINYGVLAVWGAPVSYAHRWTHLIGKWYRMSADQMDVIQVAGMTVYKIGIILFYLVPYIALRIVV